MYPSDLFGKPYQALLAFLDLLNLPISVQLLVMGEGWAFSSHNMPNCFNYLLNRIVVSIGLIFAICCVNTLIAKCESLAEIRATITEIQNFFPGDCFCWCTLYVSLGVNTLEFCRVYWQEQITIESLGYRTASFAWYSVELFWHNISACVRRTDRRVRRH